MIIIYNLCSKLSICLQNDKNSSHYEQIPLWFIGLIDGIFLVWHFYMHFDERTDTVLLYPQWRQIRKLLITGIIGWAVILLLYMLYIGEYLMLRVVMILLYGAWISVFCYIETRWLLIKLDKQRKNSALANNERVRISMDSINSIAMDQSLQDMTVINNIADENDRQIIG